MEEEDVDDRPGEISSAYVRFSTLLRRWKELQRLDLYQASDDGLEAMIRPSAGAKALQCTF